MYQDARLDSLSKFGVLFCVKWIWKDLGRPPPRRKCISARKARSLLAPKASRVAFEKAKGKASQVALLAAREAAKKQVEKDLKAQIEGYLEAHAAEVKDLALRDAVESTSGQKKQLEVLFEVIFNHFDSYLFIS